jgi:flavodoxin
VKGIVIYDSYFGNTRQVAEAIAEEIKAEGHEAELRNVKEESTTPPQGDFMFVGSPVRMGGVTGRTKRYVKHLDGVTWKEKPIAVFATVARRPEGELTEKQKASYEKWALRAGPRLRDKAKDRGFNVVDKVLAVEVTTEKGPLAEGGIEQTKQFAREVLLAIKK